MRYPDALQRSSALATRMDLQNKATNASKPIWVTVADEFMDGTDSGGLVKKHEKFIKHIINPESISKIGSSRRVKPAIFSRKSAARTPLSRNGMKLPANTMGKIFWTFVGSLLRALS
jgi:hypothetical protein